jgi:hypothetical protein
LILLFDCGSISKSRSQEKVLLIVYGVPETEKQAVHGPVFLFPFSTVSESSPPR